MLARHRRSWSPIKSRRSSVLLAAQTVQRVLGSVANRSHSLNRRTTFQHGRFLGSIVLAPKSRGRQLCVRPDMRERLVSQLQIRP
jgi:hypothetical protein